MDKEEIKRCKSDKNKKCFGHKNCKLDADPSRQLQPIKRSSALSTSSASASTLSRW